MIISCRNDVLYAPFRFMMNKNKINEKSLSLLKDESFCLLGLVFYEESRGHGALTNVSNISVSQHMIVAKKALALKVEMKPPRMKWMPKRRTLYTTKWRKKRKR